jgi:hypothetical protein
MKQSGCLRLQTETLTRRLACYSVNFDCASHGLEAFVARAGALPLVHSASLCNRYDLEPEYIAFRPVDGEGTMLQCEIAVSND